MFYIVRNEKNQIITISMIPPEGPTEQLPITHPDVQEFIHTYMTETAKYFPDSFSTRQFFAESDIELIRVLEDLINILLSKEIITLTDLPDAARHKLLKRKNIRDNLKQTFQRKFSPLE